MNVMYVWSEQTGTQRGPRVAQLPEGGLAGREGKASATRRKGWDGMAAVM